MKKLGRTGQGYLLNTIIIVLLFTAAQLVTAALGGEGSFKLVLVPSIWQCCYLMILAASLIGPENFLEYSTKDEMFPMLIFPNRYKMAPNTLIMDRERLLMKFTIGPTILP